MQTMHTYKDILGVITIVIAVVSYSDYFFSIFRGNTIPRTISWLIWGILGAIAFTVQFHAGGGAGAWITGFTAFMCFLVAGTSYLKCTEHFTLYDWVPFSGALITLVFWFLTEDALVATLLIIVTHTLGFIPTMHNAYTHPDEETAMTFVLNGVKFSIAIVALNTYMLTTWLYPSVIVLLNAILVSIIVTRRISIRKSQAIL